MKSSQFIGLIHRRTAQTCVGPSSIRNQGASGLINICRQYFEYSIDLKEFASKLKSNDYPDYLDKCTKELLNLFPKKAKSWGAARKGLNLFFRDVVYNKYLADYLNISSDYKKNIVVIKRLEVPLDRDVANGLIKLYPDLPKWTTIKSLNKKLSDQYQLKASEYAHSVGLANIHLDLILWRAVV